MKMFYRRFSSAIIMALTVIIDRNLTIEAEIGLDGARLTYAIYNLPPFDILTPLSDGNYTIDGANRILHDWMSKKLNFTIQYRIINSSMVGNLLDTEYALRLIAKKEVDVLSMGISPSIERMKIMDFAYVSWTDPYVMVVPRPPEKRQIFAFLFPFQTMVWILSIITVFALIGTIVLFKKVYRSHAAQLVEDAKFERVLALNHDASYYFMYVMANMMNQGRTDPIPRTSFRIFIGLWLLAATVVVNSYSSTVISFLTVIEPSPHINSFEDLAASEEVGVLLRRNSDIYFTIMEANSGALKILGDRVRRRPDQIPNDISQFNARLETGRYAFPSLSLYCKLFIANNFKKDGNCRFLISDPLPMTGVWLIALQKDSKYTKQFNDALIKIWETGFLSYLMKKYTPKTPDCSNPPKSSAASSKKALIKLKDLHGVFYFLGAGMALSFLTFLIECIIHKTNRKSKRKTNVKVGDTIVKSATAQPREGLVVEDAVVKIAKLCKSQVKVMTRLDIT